MCETKIRFLYLQSQRGTYIPAATLVKYNSSAVICTYETVNLSPSFYSRLVDFSTYVNLYKAQ